MEDPLQRNHLLASSRRQTARPSWGRQTLGPRRVMTNCIRSMAPLSTCIFHRTVRRNKEPARSCRGTRTVPLARHGQDNEGLASTKHGGTRAHSTCPWAPLLARHRPVPRGKPHGSGVAAHRRFCSGDQIMNDASSPNPQTPAQTEAVPPRAPPPRGVMVGIGCLRRRSGCLRDILRADAPGQRHGLLYSSSTWPPTAPASSRAAGAAHPDACAAGPGRDIRCARPRLRNPAGCDPDHHRRRAAPGVPARGAPWPPHPHRSVLPLAGRRPGRVRRVHPPLRRRHRWYPGPPGCQRIRRHGPGPDPASAQYDGILRSAIATGLVDHILPAEDMPAKLIEYATHLTASRDLRGPDGLRRGGGRATVHDLWAAQASDRP